MATLPLPTTPVLFAPNLLLGHIDLLGERVEVYLEQQGPLNKPCLYQFQAEQGGQLTGIYTGQARNGLGRPCEQYESVLKDLRHNRFSGCKISAGAPTRPYRISAPWGFRWVHHELERLLPNQSMTIKVVLRYLDPSANLTTEERAVIRSWRPDSRTWNECTMTSAGSKGKSLEPSWA